VNRLESHLPVLSAIALTAPLIGLLGTILGLVDAFVQVSEVMGYATPVQLSRGVYESLVTTAGGLAVGVPATIFYVYLSARARQLMHDMERAGIEMLNLITDAREAGKFETPAPSEAVTPSHESAPVEEMASSGIPASGEDDVSVS